MPSPNQFADRMYTIAAKVPANADALVRKVAFSIDSHVVTSTPVLTGRARSNWIVSLNSAQLMTRPTLGPTAAATQQTEARATISSYSGAVHRSIHITNNVVYINRLNEGWSAQAPAGFIEAAILRGIQSIREVDLLA